jgi:hypothetical protein
MQLSRAVCACVRYAVCRTTHAQLPGSGTRRVAARVRRPARGRRQGGRHHGGRLQQQQEEDPIASPISFPNDNEQLAGCQRHA